jgi:hypothetical protein
VENADHGDQSAHAERETDHPAAEALDLPFERRGALARQGHELTDSS